MRWIPFVILTFLVVLVQVTVGGLLRFRGLGIGSIGPDLIAIVAIFVAMYARTGADAMLAGWVLGLVVDLTTVGGPAAGTVLGPMPLAYALAAGAVYRVRGIFFRERMLTQVVLALGFCSMAHGLWVTFQSLFSCCWSGYWQMLLQALALSTYTAVLMPLGHVALARSQRMFMAGPPGRARRAP
jgi:cell shape-determining protein MreD